MIHFRVTSVFTVNVILLYMATIPELYLYTYYAIGQIQILSEFERAIFDELWNKL